MSAFADHFSATAAQYASYRPRYPAALFAWLATQTPGHDLAWDCATGTGQAAVPLASSFRAVIATDPSVEQLRHAEPRAGVRYAAMTAERPAIASSSVALVTVAQALHWFDRDAFYREVRRVLVPGGILAVWSYRLATVDEAVDAVIGRFYRETVGPYWPAERALVDAGYGALDFPFEERVAPRFAMEARWTLAQLAGYLTTWSAVARFRAACGTDPVPEVVAELRSVWPDPASERLVRWPLDIRVGARS